jgi:hypothetical protein
MIVSALRHARPAFADFSPYMLLGGTAAHLWYLPFALLASLAAVLLYRRIRPWDDRLVHLAWLATLVALFVFVWPTHSGSWTFPFGQWRFAAYSIPIGLAVGHAMRHEGARLPRLLSISTTVAACGLIVGGAEATAYAFGTALASVGFVWTPRLGRAGWSLVGLSLGVYVLHPLVISQVVHRLGWDEHHRALGAVLAIAASTALAAILRATPIRKFVV